ncbi:MAG TPA: AsmA family protein [Candidatus Saccharimonadales bacterium]|nr:AsmA family protein [Candidatus Saccharimonadales bacterium]
MAGEAMRRGVLIAVALAVAALVLPPFINVGRYKGRVTESISNALGRPVTVDSVELRLLPHPGFYLENVVVGDDPAYSAEPILHAEEVTAYLRLSSLWRARLEIARLSLKYPSLNLVEREDASWNLESLLWKASRTQAAPTASRLSQSRTRFPYIDATNGRINFKYGLEKSVFSFTEADFTLWSPAENQWRMRLEAHPVRTDMPVTDTGTVKVDTTIQRANLLRNAAMKGTMTWERVQLGNLTRLIYGEDRGWRGALETSAQFSGTPGALQFTTAAKLRDFRRYDISTGNAADLNATCSGELNMGSYQLQNTGCRLPLEGGLLSVQGNLQGLRSPHFDLAIMAETLPADALLNLARRAKRDLPEDLTAKGSVSASFHAKRMTEQPSTWIGNMVVSDLVVHSSVLGKDLVVGKAVAMANTAEPFQTKHRGRKVPAEAPIRALVVQSFDLPIGAATPASVNGTLDDERFAIHVKGDATLERLQQFARATGVGAPKIALAGPAAIDLTIGGKWTEFSAPEVTGTAQLKNTRAEVPGLSVPVEISSARLDLDHNRLTLHNASATVAKIALSGSASFPRICDGESACDSTFDLNTDDLNPERWNEVLNPHLKERPWYRLFGSGAENNVIANLHSTGHFTARRMTLGTTVASAFETNFTVSNHVLELKNAHADLLGGSFSSDWKIDFNGNEPTYESTGTAARIQVEKLATVVKATLGSGALALKYKMAMSGWDSTTLAQSAKVETDFDWSGGALRISPDGKSPLRVRSGSGKVALGHDGWTISGSQWNTPTGLYRLTGTASRDLALTMEFTQENGAVWKVSGTLLKPQLSTPPAPQPTQARRR